MKFCKNCGAKLQEGAVVCLNCGVMAGDGIKYCHNCGAQPDPLAVICVKCGCSLENFKKTKRIMSMGEATKSCFSKYASFSGRARRSEYWFFNLFCALCTLPFYIFACVMLAEVGEGELAYIPLFTGCLLQLIFFIPSLSVMVRRLHDTGRSGWWALLLIVVSSTAVGAALAIVLLALDSQPKRNEYGVCPK